MPKSREVAGKFFDGDHVATSTRCGHIRLHGWCSEQRFWGGPPGFPSSVTTPPHWASSSHDPVDVFLGHIVGYVTRDNCSLGS